jgi:molybdate transport system substrate-binding protein
MIRPASAVIVAFVAILGCAGSRADAAELKVLSAVGMRQVLLALAPEFERATGHTLVIAFESSGVIEPRVQAGATADVLMLPRQAINRLILSGKVDGTTATDLANAIIGVAVRTGAAKPDISTPDAFKRALLSARSIARADPAQGGSSAVHIAEIAERLGIAEEVNAKSVITYRADDPLDAPGYTVAAGRADIALHQMQELLSVPGIEVVGPLPAALQQAFLFSAAVMTGAKEREAAVALIVFCSRPPPWRSSERRECSRRRGDEPRFHPPLDGRDMAKSARGACRGRIRAADGYVRGTSPRAS